MPHPVIYNPGRSERPLPMPAPFRRDCATLVNRDGDTAEISRPLLRIGSEGAAREITAEELSAPRDTRPVPVWVWLLCIVTALVAGAVLAS